MSSFTRKTSNVNSPKLLEALTSGIEELIMDSTVDMTKASHRDSFLDVMEDWFNDNIEQGLIEQFNVICDNRNNTKQDLMSGDVIVDLYYRQRHCLNITHVRYFLTTAHESDPIVTDFVI